MRIFVNRTARRFFVGLVTLTLGLPVLAVLVLVTVSRIGFQGEAFMALLGLNFVFFSPVHYLFGSALMPVQEFGPIPGVAGVTAAIGLYGVGSYCLANVLGAIVGKRDGS
jgi:hypothetical protein